jgi:hypothetical protein
MPRRPDPAEFDQPLTAQELRELQPLRASTGC